MTPVAYINHRIPHRLRIRVPSKQGDSAYFNRIRENLGHCDEIVQIHTNPITASVLIFYRKDTHSIFNYSKKHKLFDLQNKEEKNPRPPLIEGIFKEAEIVDHALIKMSEGSWDLKSTFAMGLLGMAFLQISKGYYLPPAWSLLKDAFNYMSERRFNPS